MTYTTHPHHHSQTPQRSPCALPCLGLQVMRQGGAALQAQQNLKKRRTKIIFLCESNSCRRGEGVRDENKRSTVPPSPGGSRSEASATAAAVSARAFASSALSSCTCACVAVVVICFCVWRESGGEAAREVSEGWWVRLRFKGACWGSASGGGTGCARRRWQPCV